MVTLYIVSSEKGSGKTAFCAGVGKNLAGAGKKVGFFKPVITDGISPAAPGIDSDAAFMKQIMALPEPADALCPLISAAEILNNANKLKETFAAVSQGKDVVIAEGLLGSGPDDQLSQASRQIARALEARVIVIGAYPLKSPQLIDECQQFGSHLLGVVLNKVPGSRLKQVAEAALPRLRAAGMNTLGTLAEDRTLLAPTIGELAGCVQGKILNSAERSADLVENLLAGALVVDSGLQYFGRKANKAAIIRDDRPDMQLAALETSTKCLILTGKMAPVYYRVMQKAQSKKIPLVQAEGDTDSIITRIEKGLVGAKFAQEKKLPRLAELLRQAIDFQVLFRGLGLAR